MGPLKLLCLKTAPDILLTINMVRNDPDWEFAHKRVRAFHDSIYDNLHNDEVHGVKHESTQERAV
jgi:hypothetical protein